MSYFAIKPQNYMYSDLIFISTNLLPIFFKRVNFGLQ